MKLKKILTLSVGLALAGCQLPKMNQMAWHSEGENQPVKVAVMLPLSEKSAEMGRAFQNSMMMALEEHPDSRMELMFFDTKGTADGVKEAWETAERQKPDLILGPVLTEEVKALKSEVSIPMISFTTDQSVLGKDVYSLGVLIPNQVDRIVESMCVAGHRKIAVIGPENKTGELTMNALSEVVQKCPGMELTKVALYEPETVNFAPEVLKIIPTPVDPRKKNLTAEEKRILETPIQERLDFDALFIYESGVKLQQITSLLAYYDVSPKVVPFYGLAVWQSSKDRGLIGGYYAGTPNQKTDIFMHRYQQAFGEKPQKIATLGYDAVSLVEAVSQKGGWDEDMLTQETGFNGVNGRFRLLDDGRNERLLDVFQIGPGMKAKVVEPAPTEFRDSDDFFVPLPVEEVSEQETPIEPVIEPENKGDGNVL